MTLDEAKKSLLALVKDEIWFTGISSEEDTYIILFTSNLKAASAMFPDRVWQGWLLEIKYLDVPYADGPIV